MLQQLCYTVLCCAVVQIVDMELPAGSSILGARILPGTSKQQGDEEQAAAAVHQGGSCGCLQLLLLTASQLVCYVISAPQ